jgi:hypothetical protein
MLVFSHLHFLKHAVTWHWQLILLVGLDHLIKSLLCRTVAYFCQNINDSEKNVFTNTSSGARGQGQEDRRQEGRVEAGQDLRRKVQGRHHRGRYPGTLRPGVSLTKLLLSSSSGLFRKY